MQKNNWVNRLVYKLEAKGYSTEAIEKLFDEIDINKLIDDLTKTGKKEKNADN